MGIVTLVEGSVRHVVNLLGPRPAGHVRQAVVLLQAFDELTDEPVRVPLTVTSQVPGLIGRVAQSGVCGLLGAPSRAFPSLDATAYGVDVRVEAAGYSPWTRSLTLPAQGAFPASFTGLDLGRINLHRHPVTIEVRTFELTAQGRTVPLGGADVRITSIWRRTGDLPQPGLPARIVGLPLGTSQRWPVGARLDSVSLVPIAEPTRRLARAAAPGDTRLFVDRAGALAPSDLVGLDLADAERREYVPMLSVVSPGDPGSPAELELAGPIRVLHADGVQVRRVAPPAPGPPDTTTTDIAEAGDTVAFVAATAPFATVEIVRAAGATIADEYLDSHLYRTISTIDGLARLPALSRLAAVEITATLGALSAAVRVSPDYLTPVNTVGLTLR